MGQGGISGLSACWAVPGGEEPAAGNQPPTSEELPTGMLLPPAKWAGEGWLDGQLDTIAGGGADGAAGGADGAAEAAKAVSAPSRGNQGDKEARKLRTRRQELPAVRPQEAPNNTPANWPWLFRIGPPESPCRAATESSIISGGSWRAGERYWRHRPVAARYCPLP